MRATLLLGLVGCGGGDTLCFCGPRTFDLFPFDGDRTWVYVHTDPSMPYRLVIRTVGSEVVDGRAVYTVEHATECTGPGCLDGQVLRTVRWSSTAEDGVMSHGWSEGELVVDLDPPVVLAAELMQAGDEVTTVTGGATWTSTLVGTEPCPIAFTANWDLCVVFELESTGDGWPLAGTYHAAKYNNVAAFEIAGDTGRWELWDFDCEGDCDGIW